MNETLPHALMGVFEVVTSNNLRVAGCPQYRPVKLIVSEDLTPPSST